MKKLHLLILEDNPDDFYLLKETIRTSKTLSSRTYHASTLKQAIETVRTKEVDLAVLDLNLPDSNGLDTYVSFAAKFPHIPVVVMTGYKNQDLAIRAVQKGAQDYIFKGETSNAAIDRTILYAIERHRLINELKASTETIRKLSIAVEQSPVSIVITDVEGQIEYVNRQFSEMTGYEKAEVIGANPRILQSGKVSPETFEQLWRTILSNKSWQGELCNKKKNGELYWENAVISPIVNDQGHTINFIAVKEDITDKKALEQLKEDVNHIMQHDLKGPLTGIINLPELLKLEGDLNREQERIADLIEQTGNTMINMINLSLDIFKMENNEYTYQPRQVDFPALLFRLFRENRARMSRKGLDCLLMLNGNPLLEDDVHYLWSEPDLAYPMLSNLFINAIEASPENEIISIDIRSGSDTEVTIANKGAVSEQIRKDFFGKYKTFGKRKGTGLGTYSAKLMADVMQYTLEMETSDEDDTTCITIHIPNDPPF